MLKFTRRSRSRDDLVGTQNGIVSYSTDTAFNHQSALLSLSPLQDSNTNRGPSNRHSLSKTVSFRAFNAIARSIKSKFSSEKVTPTKQHSQSVECILSSNNRIEHQQEPYHRSYSDDEQSIMPTLRRVESERNGVLHSARQRPVSLYASSAVENQKSSLSHAQSFDGLHHKHEESNSPVRLSFYHQPSLPPASSNIGNHHRSMSHRELTRHSDGIVDAFGFASSSTHTSAYQSTSNIHYGRSEQMHNFQHRKPPEVPKVSTSYHPTSTAPHESRSYKVERNWRPPLQSQSSVLTPTNDQATFSSSVNMDKENHPGQRKASWDPPKQQRNSFISLNKESQQQPPSQPVSKNSFGPVVKRAESMKRIMQKNRKSENLTSPAVSNSFDDGGSEVVTEKGRSVKSIVGMFDQQPAIHAALAKAKMAQANNSLKEEKQSMDKTTPQSKAPHPMTNGSRSDRNGTQVVHIAKFMQLESTPERSTNYTDAQTSPMQLSPIETFTVQAARPSIAKAETFSGSSKPKVAVMTPSTSSSYMSNEVFTPGSDSMDSPVFEADLQYHRKDSSARTHYSDDTAHGGYDIAHDSYIPTSTNQRYSPQHPHIHSQLMRQEQADTESSNHYEDLESLRTAGSAHEMENIYEPISPLRREPLTGNYMNFPASPSSDYIDMSPTHMSQLPKQGSVADRPSLDSSHMRPSSLPMDTHSPRQLPVSNGSRETQEEESYSNQVREASHRTLRQTSVESSRFRSPTSEEQAINRYNLANTNVNRVAPVQGTSRSTAPIRPQAVSPYNSEANIANQEPVNMRKRAVPQRTDSCRIPPRSKPIDRTSSYRECRGSSMDIRGNDPKASIRDNLIDFYKRKSRDSGMDVTLDNVSGQAIHNSISTPTITQSPTRSPHGVPMQRIQSERSFSTRNMINPRGSSLDRTPSMQVPNHHRNSADMTDARRNEAVHSYMQSWDASTVANRSSSSTSSEQSPNGALVQNESPRVKKPLVAEVSPFSMPVQKSRKERPSRLDTSTPSSNAGSGVLKPMKASVTQADNISNGDVAPTLPPRNYHPEEITTAHLSGSETKPSHSELDLSGKPYQNVFNGNSSGKTGGDDYDAGYADQLRRLSKNQYVPKSSPQHPVSRANGQQVSPPTNQSLLSQQSPLSSSHSNILSPHSTAPSNLLSPQGATPTSVHSAHGVNSAKVQHRHSISVSSHPSKPVPRQQFVSIERTQVLETDIDGPSSPEIQPPPPPRRPAKNFDYSKPPQKPPKLSTSIYHQEINHNDPSTLSAPNLPDTVAPLAEQESNVGTDNESPSMHHNKSLQLSSRLHQGLQSTPHGPQPAVRKERGRSESMITTRAVDLTVTSGDPTAHLNRRHSVGKTKNRRSVSAAGVVSKEEKVTPQAHKMSPSSRLHQRETEFSAIEKPEQAVSERLEPDVISDVINGNRPKPRPFDRYHPVSSSHENLVSHSRHGSSELLDTLPGSPSSVNYRKKGRVSPTPMPRSPKLSPDVNRSVRDSLGSLCDSRKSTPSPHSSSSDVARQAKSDPSTPVDKTFVPISAEILADLADQGIDITEKHKCISDESKARLVKISTLNSSSPPASKKNPSIKHIRQKSSDEILCDTQVENIGRSIKDETLSQVLSKPERGTTDYLPGLFDDLLNKTIPRKPRQSVDSSPCHSKQSSEGDSLVSSKTGSTKDYDSPFDSDIKPLQDQKEELVLVLKKKLSVLQGDERFIKQEIEDNENSGTQLVQLVEAKCNEREIRKFKAYMDDVETITRLLLKLSRRLARAENELRNAPMDATDDDKKCLEQKRNGLQRQHTEAKTLKGNIDKRKALVDSFLNRCLDSAEFQQYDHYISIKLKLIMEISDIEDQVCHCEEQINAVTAISK